MAAGVLYDPAMAGLVKVAGCLFMIGFGAALVLSAVAGVRALAERVWLRVRGNYATGVVVGVDVREDPDYYTRYTPMVEFVTRAGEQRVEKVAYSTTRECSVGDSVRVFYRPRDLSHVFVADWFQGAWIIVFFPVLVAAGIAFIGVGVLILLDVHEVRFAGWVVHR